MTPWIRYWQQHPLPILQASKLQLQTMLRRAERLQLADIEALVWSDPMLSAQVLRHINQRPRTAMAAEVVAVEHMVMLTGVAPFLQRCLASPVLEELLPAATLNKVLQLVARARQARLLMREFGNLRNDAYPEEIQTASLLAVVPAILNLIGPYLSPVAPASEGSTAAALWQAWQMPQALVELLGAGEVATPRVALQQSAVKLVAASERGWWSRERLEQAGTIASILGQDPEQVLQLANRLQLQFAARDWPYAQYVPPAVYLPMVPGAWPAPPAPEAPKPALDHAAIRLSERMQALHLAGVQGAPTNQVMGLTIRALSEGLGLQRIAFALLQPAEQVLRTRFVHGVAEGDALRALQLPLQQPGVMTQLLQKSQSLWLNSESLARYREHLPPALQACAADNYFLMSVFVGKQPLGIIYADAPPALTLTEHHYQHFQQIGMLTSRALTQYARRVS